MAEVEVNGLGTNKAIKFNCDENLLKKISLLSLEVLIVKFLLIGVMFLTFQTIPMALKKFLSMSLITRNHIRALI